MMQSTSYSRPAGDHAGRGDPRHALAVRVDQVRVRVVEGLQVLVVEAGPLAQRRYHAFSFPAVSGSRTMASARARISSIFSKSDSS